VQFARGALDVRRWRAHPLPMRLLTLLSFLALPTLGCASIRGADDARPVRVLVYNIHAGRDAAGADNLERVAALVREVGADVTLLQEVDRGTERSGRVDQVAELARRTGMHAAFGRTLDYQGGEYGIAILSRWPIADDTLIHLPVEPPQQRAGGSYEPRGAQRALVARPGGSLAVLNTHLDASGHDRFRAQEIEHIIALAGASAVSVGRSIVGGDFNATPESAVIARARAAGLRDAWSECGGDPKGGLTYPAVSPVKRIDYLFLRGDLRCLSARVLDSDASDHRPVVFEVGRGA
jgi:endonuclease/exonuclease/phosphatase family metal-dependent hydrolase